MTHLCAVRVLLVTCAACVALALPGSAQTASLPEGVKAVWDLGQAYRETTPTRERVCINGLWRWQPAAEGANQVPDGSWGYFKVPGAWPGHSDWLMKDCQTLYPHPSWQGRNLGDVTAAWYQREITIPAAWAGRRIALQADTVNSYAAVFVDGKSAGEMRFPGGEVDLTALCRPGSPQVLSLLVVAMPLHSVMMSFNDTAQARQVAGEVERRGLCGDLWLVGAPQGPRLAEARVYTSVRKWQITFGAELQDLAPDASYTLRARITDPGQPAPVEFTSNPFTAADVKDGRFAFTAGWHPAKLWDLNTPQNMLDLSLTLQDAGGKELDTWQPVRFGFREFWIQGRDFYLNGTRIFLSVVPLDNAQIGAAWASYQGARESLTRLKAVGFNFLYTHNYGCEPGTHLSFAEILRAADDVGVLVALSQPHFGQYDWQAPDADQSNGYARHARFYVRVAQNHPSVVAYSMSHNACGYVEDMNPDTIDGLKDPREDWARNYVGRALRAQAIVNGMDPTRIVYHHSSGNLGTMHTNNFYANFTPTQELADWFEHWATVGAKPLFLCEFGAPLTWDFTMYRGWYRGGRSWGSAQVPWELNLAEWNSQLFGDAAFRCSEAEKTSLRWEAKRFQSGQLWFRWDYPIEIGSYRFTEQYPAEALGIADEWRAFRTWGVSAINAWEYGNLWTPRPGVGGRKDLPVDWDHLQRPGLSPDYIDQRYGRRDLDYELSDWNPTPAAEALTRYNMPLLAYLAGKASGFTGKDHNFLPGETVEKQLILINNSRETVTADCTWALALPQATATTGSKQVTIQTGQQERIPLTFALPADLAAGDYEITATAKFSQGDSQKDSLTLHVLPPAPPVSLQAKVALFDPKDETGKLLTAMGVQCRPVEAGADLSGYDLLLVGKGALTADGPGPDLSRVREGLRVIVFEQTAEAMEKRLGFRASEYGLRNVFARVPDHPALAGLSADTLRDWRGEATILPPRLKYTLSPSYQGTTPVVQWCGIDVPRIWRCGCRGNVASVLIEKPARGDFLPLIDGGYSLQFSPLMEYREGKGLVVFCQLDVTGRTEADPAADRLIRNLLGYVAAWQPSPRRTAVYVGNAEGRRHLEAAGITAATYDGGKLSGDQVLVVGAGGGQELAANAAAVGDFLKAGGNLLALGLDEQEANAFLPFTVRMARQEHICCVFDRPARATLLTGVGPADVHNRAPRELPLVRDGAQVIGDGVLAKARDLNVVFYQLPPYTITKAHGEVASLVVDDRDALDGKRSALVTLGSAMESGGQFGQSLKTGGEAGKTYTFAVSVKPLGGPATMHLEVERSVSPWDRAVRGPNVEVPENGWTEIHVTFKVEKPFTQGWQAYIGCGQDGARFRADVFRLYEGDYVPWKPGQDPAAGNMFANPSFEEGADQWWFFFGEQYNLRRTFRRSSFTLTRLLANMGVAGATPLLARFGRPVAAGGAEKRWLDGLYLDQPEAWDDPYRFFCW